MVDEWLLPEHITKKAHIAEHGEYAWKKEDLEEVIATARSIGLASVGGQVQFIFPSGTYELYWLAYGSEDRKPDETWASYVDRSAAEVLAGFKELCANTDFRAEAGNYKGFDGEVRPEGSDPLDYLWFVAYFMSEASGPMFDDWQREWGDHIR